MERQGTARSDVLGHGLARQDWLGREGLARDRHVRDS